MFSVYRFYYGPEYVQPGPPDPALIELHQAASTGNTEACSALIKRNPKIIDSVKHETGTALHSAVAGGHPDGHVETINRLIELEADREASYLDHTPLDLAVRLGRPKALQALLDKKCDPEGYQDGGGNYGPLHGACIQKDTEIVQILLRAGAQIDREGYEGEQPLHVAAAHNNPDIIRLLLNAGADPNVLAEREFRTPLHRAATDGKLRTVKALLAGGADPDGFRVSTTSCMRKPEINHFPPIGFAIINDHCDVVSELVKSGADLKLPVKFREALKEVISELVSEKIAKKKLDQGPLQVDDGDSDTQSSSDDNDSSDDEGLKSRGKHLSWIHFLRNPVEPVDPGNMIAPGNMIDPGNMIAPENMIDPGNMIELENMFELESNHDIEEDIERLLNCPTFKKISEKRKVQLYGKFGINHPELKGTMEPLKYSVCTEKTEIIGILMMSGKYSSDDIGSLRVLAKTHELSKSLQAIEYHSPYIQPEGLSVMPGGAFKRNDNNPTDVDACSSINRLDIPENLPHFSQQPSETGEEQNG